MPSGVKLSITFTGGPQFAKLPMGRPQVSNFFTPSNSSVGYGEFDRPLLVSCIIITDTTYVRTLRWYEYFRNYGITQPTTPTPRQQRRPGRRPECHLMLLLWRLTYRKQLLVVSTNLSLVRASPHPLGSTAPGSSASLDHLQSSRRWPKRNMKWRRRAA